MSTYSFLMVTINKQDTCNNEGRFKTKGECNFHKVLSGASKDRFRKLFLIRYCYNFLKK